VPQTRSSRLDALDRLKDFFFPIITRHPPSVSAAKLGNGCGSGFASVTLSARLNAVADLTAVLFLDGLERVPL
jgi:hypothetical protein